MILDISTGGQSYTEDCEVCCNPIEISFEVEDNTISAFTAKSTEE